jgi:DNA-binding IclR family transcriptional regulator
MQSLATNFRILGTCCGERSTRSGTGLAAALGLEKPLVARNLVGFPDVGFLKQDAATNAYPSDIRSFLPGAQFLIGNDLVREAGAELRRLTERTIGSIHAGVAVGLSLVFGVLRIINFARGGASIVEQEVSYV